MYPPAPFVQRTPAAPCQLGGYSLVPGQWIYVATYALHYNAECFPEPTMFRPERFRGSDYPAASRYVCLHKEHSLPSYPEHHRTGKSMVVTYTDGCVCVAKTAFT